MAALDVFIHEVSDRSGWRYGQRYYPSSECTLDSVARDIAAQLGTTPDQIVLRILRDPKAVEAERQSSAPPVE
jgi:hypothetical protein